MIFGLLLVNPNSWLLGKRLHWERIIALKWWGKVCGFMPPCLGIYTIMFTLPMGTRPIHAARFVFLSKNRCWSVPSLYFVLTMMRVEGCMRIKINHLYIFIEFRTYTSSLTVLRVKNVKCNVIFKRKYVVHTLFIPEHGFFN